MKLHKLASAKIPTDCGEFRVYAFGKDENDYIPHLALVNGEFDRVNSVLVRIHSECITGDLFRSKRCDCGDQLEKSLKRIGKEGGVLLYLRQEGRGIGIVNKLKAYNLQDEGLNTAEANEALGFPIDQRDFKVAIKILKKLNIFRVKLLTNNPNKIKFIFLSLWCKWCIPGVFCFDSVNFPCPFNLLVSEHDFFGVAEVLGCWI